MIAEESASNSLYKNRRQAGKHLARKLLDYKDRSNVIVLGIPSGGVPVAYEVAQKLNAPLDIFVVRKLGVPGQEELVMGAIAHGDAIAFNHDVIRHVPQSWIDEVRAQERKELEEREKKLRGERLFPTLTDQIAILVDDGLASGSSMRVAIRTLRHFGPTSIVVAIPVSAPDVCDSLKDLADDVVCAITPRPFYGVGMWYEDFNQTTDKEVLILLNQQLVLYSGGMM